MIRKRNINKRYLKIIIHERDFTRAQNNYKSFVRYEARVECNSLPIIVIIPCKTSFFVSVSPPIMARYRRRRGFNFLVFTKAPDLRRRHKLGHPEPCNLDRYAIKSTRDRLRSPRGYQHPRPRPTNGRTFNYLFCLSYREKEREEERRSAHEPDVNSTWTRLLLDEVKQTDTNRKALTKLDCQHKRTKFRSDKRLPFHLFDRLYIDNLDLLIFTCQQSCFINKSRTWYYLIHLSSRRRWRFAIRSDTLVTKIMNNFHWWEQVQARWRASRRARRREHR